MQAMNQHARNLSVCVWTVWALFLSWFWIFLLFILD
jgi:hypothetical protein